MKIGYLVSQYPAVNHTFILREIRTLRRLGWDVRVISVRRADRAMEALSEEEAEEARQTHELLGAGKGEVARDLLAEFLARPWGLLSGLFGAWGLAGMRPGLWKSYSIYFLGAVLAARKFRQQGVEHIHTHFASTVALLLWRYAGIAYSVTIHGPDEFNDVVGFHMAEKVAAAKMVAAISHYAASQIQKASAPEDWGKVVVLPLGVDPEAFRPRALPQRVPGEDRELVFVGRLAPAKAQQVLIEMVRQLRQEGMGVRLTLVGEGPSRAFLEQKIADYGLQEVVRLAGAQNHDRVREYYQRADAFVLASFAEGVPVVLMEAMAMEVVCVATWITGIPELIRDGVEGLLVAPADVRGLAAAVRRVLEDGELAASLGRAGRRQVEEKYNLERNAAELGRVLAGYLASAESTSKGELRR